MSTGKRIWLICIGAGLMALLIALLLISGVGTAPDLQVNAMGYEDRIFNTDRIHSIEIYLDDWDGFLQTCVEEEYTRCTVRINKEQFDNVGIRAKGNSSLTTVSEMGSCRYSLKLEFDHYNSGQSYHGLDKLNLNNLIQDNTMMKDYLTYRMMAEIGAAAPLCSYAQVYVNEQPLGLYLAVEAIEESFLLRNYGSDYGELYKPDADNGQDSKQPKPPAAEQQPQLRGEALRQALQQQRIPTNRLKVASWDSVTMEDLPELMKQLPGVDVPALMQALMASATPDREDEHLKDVKLQYLGDDPDCYPNIFDGSKTDITPEDQARLIRSLKQLSTGTKLKTVVDREAVIRYFAVHNFVCNEDSYTGSTVHNYYLYEKDGQLSMLPWDYNLAFGGMPAPNAAAVVNASIYEPVPGGTYKDRPMLSWILDNQNYRWLYKRYLMELLNVDMGSIVQQTASMIAPYVQRDPTKFCTYEEFESGVDALLQFLELRSESVQQQLLGKPANVDVGDLSLTAMGGVSTAADTSKPHNKENHSNERNDP